ncbi:ABC transporter ATP-binding protein [Conexibacter sp. JD483]|uniref:oligopeptide/dipeptide ABC transporter ATP-binding protein n=1 Tax=unclassified Conexibacter TaxID=2627773 RepID=UPI0027199812|nr:MULTISPECIES: ABC transporter ATP-binding protein [unclassified Conexibacter]MDO8187877.1 ABC transporter ATP-binding protein [Conexibacter sp. CPCC 205706]MDO8201229.1 ABC transporter ATP-binding protein [Conexibacter sp. CPCC 205762]MDR9369759.1 ABC transporter ATP-binding protein [Conexibacter sp. JD483]
MSTTAEAPRGIAAEAIEKRFAARGRARKRGEGVRAVDDVSLTVAPGEIVGLVGESGCGKSTLSRILIGIETPSAGRVLLDGEPVDGRDGWRRLRRRVQYVFQDPYGSLCPTMTIGETLTDALAVNDLGGSTAGRRELAGEMLARVGLSAADLDRRPSQFSGGQRQRIGLARALILEPEVIVCDEIVSGLDVSVQASILNLLRELRQRLGVGLLFISHDLRVVRYLCDRVVVMYLGRIVEQGSVEEVFGAPAHPYTQGLLASVPDHMPGAPELRAHVAGEPATLSGRPQGCPFAPRCPQAAERCRSVDPPFVALGAGDHRARCLFPEPPR